MLRKVFLQALACSLLRDPSQSKLKHSPRDGSLDSTNFPIRPLHMDERWEQRERLSPQSRQCTVQLALLLQYTIFDHNSEERKKEVLLTTNADGLRFVKIRVRSIRIPQIGDTVRSRDLR